MYMQMVYAWFFPKHKPQIYGVFFLVGFCFFNHINKSNLQYKNKGCFMNIHVLILIEIRFWHV